MWRAVAVVCALAGCSSDEVGLHVVVHDSTGHAVSADLYLPVKQADVDGMAPPKQSKMTGDVYYLDTDAMSPTVRTHALLSGGRVVFNVLPQDAGQPVAVKSIAVIARDANGAPVGFGTFSPPDLAPGESAQYRLDLAPASELDLTTPATAPGTRIYEWSAWKGASERTECVEVERRTGAPNEVPGYAFFVPQDDTDCDGRGVECDDFAYEDADAQPAPPSTLLNAKCGELSMSGEACGLGFVPTCANVPPSTCRAFHDKRYCAPVAACDLPTCFADPAECLRDELQSQQRPTFVDCVFPVNDLATSGVNCTLDSGMAHLDFAAELAQMLNINVSCATPRLWLPGDPQGAAATASLAQGIERPVFQISQPTTAECRLVISYLSGERGERDAYGAVDIELAPAGTGNHIVLPLRATFVECGQGPAVCHVVAVPSDAHSLKECAP